VSRPTRIAVLGMGRSGTTIVTDLLGASGVYLDEVNWAFEHEEARAINDPYLERHFGAVAGSLPYGRLPDEEIRVTEPEVRSAARGFVEEMDRRAGERSHWAFKDPRTTILHDMWLEHVDVVVACVRRPDHVVESYMKQGWITGWRPRRTALRYWTRFNESLLCVLEGNGSFGRYVLETSSDLIPQLDAVNAQLGLELSPEARDRFDPARQAAPGSAGLKGRERELYERLIALRTHPA
jgi:hypothetical protein